MVCLQETKVEDATFPHELFTARGYHVEMWGQRTYNGVAIASKFPMADVGRGFATSSGETTEWMDQARLISATTNGVRISSVYVPNGQQVGSEKYAYKLQWLNEFAAWLARSAPPLPRVLCGDFNIAPQDSDVYDAVAWGDAILCSRPERQALAEVCATAFCDSFRSLHPAAREYSWWDHRTGAFFRDKGLRIDLILTNPAATKHLEKAWIERAMRAGANPSDHAPVGIELRR